MSKHKLPIGALLCAAIFGAVSAEPPKALSAVLKGEVSSERVRELTKDVHWLTDLHQAQETAKADGKLIFWVHMVGTMEGAT